MTKTRKNLLPQVVDILNLYDAFEGAAAGKRQRPEVQRFEFNLEARLHRMRQRVIEGRYRWGNYRRFLIHDPKQREIRAPPFRDRVLHHAIVNVCDPLFERGFIADTYACIRGRGQHRAVERYRQFVRARRGQGYVLKCDIAGYFRSVDHEVLTALLARRIGDPQLLALLASLITHGAEGPGIGMPIGSLTSQMFANLYLDPLDHFVKESLRVRHYLRYMDDFILLLDDRAQARRRLAEIETFLNERLRLCLNPRRRTIAPLSAACDVLGYVHQPDGRVRVRRRNVQRLRTRVAALEEDFENGWGEWNHVRSSLASWVGLAGRADAFRLSRQIFTARDVRNIGKRLVVKRISRN